MHGFPYAAAFDKGETLLVLGDAALRFGDVLLAFTQGRKASLPAA